MADEELLNQDAAAAGGTDERSGTGTSQGAQEINRQLKEELTGKKAQKLGMNYVNVGKTPINSDVLHLIDKDRARAAWIIPFYRLGKKIRLALAHPTNKETLTVIDLLKQQGYELNFNLATEESIAEAFKNYDSGAFQKEVKPKELETGELKSYAEELVDLADLGRKIEGMTSEDALNSLNVASVRTGASDIHIQPEENSVLVRFRIDGLLHKITGISHAAYEQLANQLKYQAKLKLNITNLPQDGRYFFRIDGRKIDVRVSAMPTEFGETFVCRLLDSGHGLVVLEDLGFTERNWEILQKAVKITEGMILLTGPTGSGKTTTLYSMLNVFNRPEIKIITLEDPIEYHIDNIAQSQINEKRGYSFASGLKTILRQDPDVVMIGEIRDLDTAQTATQAALTGHVVLSTLHTNSAVETIPRLLNMGLESFMIAPASFAFIAQRLVRKICQKCLTEEPVAEAQKSYLEETLVRIKSHEPEFKENIPERLKKGQGCQTCSNTGYAGRISLVEVLLVDDVLKKLILDRASGQELQVAARKQGMLTLQEDGVKKVLRGLTTLDEVQRVVTAKEA